MTNSESSLTRRLLVGGAGAGLVGVAALSTPVLAERSADMSEQMMEDPRGKYPRPPFERQSQSWPGLASKMVPAPDHEERSYKGSGRLAGRKALITGGNSGMGRAAAIAYAREGADVAINYWPSEEPDAQEVIELIKAEGRIGLAIFGDIREESFCQLLVAKAVSGLGGLDIIVSNAGWQQTHASILDISGTIRLDDENQHLRAILDHQSGAPTSKTRLGDNWNSIGTGLRPFSGFT